MAVLSRASRAFSFAIVCSTVTALAQPISEQEAVRVFLEQSPQARRASLAERAEAAARRDRAQPSNPRVSYQVEQAGGVRDEYLALEQEIPLNGRRKLLLESAVKAASAAGLVAQRDLRSAVAALRAAFVEVLYRERVKRRLSETSARLERLVQVLAAREREGEGSGYDRLRAEQELARIEIAASEAGAAVSAARERLGAFFEDERRMAEATLEGSLELPEAPPNVEDAVRRALAQRSDLKALRADQRRLELEQRAARRRRFPEPTLAAGWKRTESLGVGETGFTASLTLPVPVFDSGRIAAVRAGADRQRTAVERQILERRVRADVKAAIARERAAREAVVGHGRGLAERAIELRRIAKLAYDEGEAGILELLDAHRTSLEAHLRALALRYQAKKAAIARDRATGDEVKP
jgi:cobalt-zinc-cadmium efflux system outer membrane protein